MEAIVTVGIPASGKSTFAKQKSQEGYFEINRDNIRDIILKQKYPNEKHLSRVFFWKQKWEKEVNLIEKEELEKAIALKLNIIVSNMNLNKGRREALVKTLTANGYQVSIVEFPITYDEAIKRDKARADGCGYDVIRIHYNNWLTYLEDKKQFSRYIPDISKPAVLMFDIDGTVAHMNDRSPFDWNKVGEDTVDPLMKFLIESWVNNNKTVIFLSGRDGICYNETKQWIENKLSGIVFDKNAHLFMRQEKDMRKDSIIKEELFNQYVKDHFNVEAVFDDRPQVVRMWHDLGLKVWACGDQMINF